MNYKKLYRNIIIKYKKLNLIKNKNVYLEEHHIIPKCIGGTNIKENLINLTPKAHFICHYLLTKIYKNDSKKYSKLFQAFFMLCAMHNSSQKRWKISSRQYNKIRIRYSNLRKITPQSESANEKRRRKLKGKIPWNKGYTKENNLILKKISEDMKVKMKNRVFTKEHRINISNALKLSDKKRGKNNHWFGTRGPMFGKKHSNEWKIAASIRMTKNNPFKNKKHTEETKKINSEKIKNKWKDPIYREKILKYRKTKVMCIETGIIYSNAQIASRMTKIKNIINCCKKEIENAGGYHWKFL